MQYIIVLSFRCVSIIGLTAKISTTSLQKGGLSVFIFEIMPITLEIFYMTSFRRCLLRKKSTFTGNTLLMIPRKGIFDS